ncbi:hypothetical protein COLO4_05307 [Corchorus olitorius]|uniref:FBD domain-containing protein n=1 Tax=Corchorus olitorius TaxID=93759 RepID=A0A1R3KR79_9ROSI|nr:hypothetical protein COLO4_05307 [Corchorus olitorius]
MISGTKLKLFCYQGVFENDFCVFDAPSLEEADMVQLGSDDIEDNLEMQIAAYRCYKLFKGLANVKRLQVTNGSLEFLASAEELVSRLPSLPNLKHLAINEHEYAADFACIGLLKILQNSPCLESIDFKKGVYLSTYDENNDWTLDPVPPCFLTHLKTVTIRLFSASDQELHVVKTLLRTARILEELRFSSKLSREIQNVLLSLREESACDITFSKLNLF